MKMYTINIEEGQTIWDVAIQVYGDVFMAWQLVKDNAGVLVDLNTDLVPGMVLNIQVEPLVKDKELMNHFRTQKTIINCRD
jgi:hypothetical protein